MRAQGRAAGGSDRTARGSRDTLSGAQTIAQPAVRPWLNGYGQAAAAWEIFDDGRTKIGRCDRLVCDREMDASRCGKSTPEQRRARELLKRMGRSR